jgi:hypothetical protein
VKILFVTTKNPKAQGDYLEMSVLHGLRKILGDNCVDYPRKKIMYHDFSETKKEELHGMGFSLLHEPLKDISKEIRGNELNQKYDAVLYGDGHIYGEQPNIEEFNSLGNNNSWIIDGHDLYGQAPRKVLAYGEYVIGTQFNKCFKRELVEENLKNVYPTGFGIPESRILSTSTKKVQLIPSAVPSESLFEKPVARNYKFLDEENYYKDLAQSWFGLSCKKGGWDCLRHYEIIAAGALLLFKDYDSKPSQCSPQNLPCYSYGSMEELNYLLKTLPGTDKYYSMLSKQKKWLLEHGTTEARSRKIIKVIRDELNDR